MNAIKFNSSYGRITISYRFEYLFDSQDPLSIQFSDFYGDENDPRLLPRKLFSA